MESFWEELLMADESLVVNGVKIFPRGNSKKLFLRADKAHLATPRGCYRLWSQAE